MAHVEPMDLDGIESDFDNKENTFHINNALPRSPCFEKVHENLDVSEVKHICSFTQRTSSMSKSFTANIDKNISDVEDHHIVNSNSNLTQSLNSTLANCNGLLKSPKSLPLQSIPTSQCTDLNKNTIDKRSFDANSNINLNIDGADMESLSLPSSSLSHTPEATTPTKEIPKDGGSPIMRGSKKVRTMFRSSQTLITPILNRWNSPVQDRDDENKDSQEAVLNLQTVDSKPQTGTGLASTPMKNSKRNCTSKESEMVNKSDVDCISELEDQCSIRVSTAAIESGSSKKVSSTHFMNDHTPQEDFIDNASRTEAEQAALSKKEYESSAHNEKCDTQVENKTFDSTVNLDNNENIMLNKLSLPNSTVTGDNNLTEENWITDLKNDFNVEINVMEALDSNSTIKNECDIIKEEVFDINYTDTQEPLCKTQKLDHLDLILFDLEVENINNSQSTCTVVLDNPFETKSKLLESPLTTPKMESKGYNFKTKMRSSPLQTNSATDTFTPIETINKPNSRQKLLLKKRKSQALPKKVNVVCKKITNSTLNEAVSCVKENNNIKLNETQPIETVQSTGKMLNKIEIQNDANRKNIEGVIAKDSEKDNIVMNDNAITTGIEANNDNNQVHNTQASVHHETYTELKVSRNDRKELTNRLGALESQVKTLEYESEERLRKIKDLTNQLSEKTKQNKNMATAVEQYERTITSLVAELEQSKKQHAEEQMLLIKDRNELTVHLSILEISFNDLHSKYEKSKKIILSLKANEDCLKKSLQEFEDNQVKIQNNYVLLKQHATGKLNHANQEFEKLKKGHEAEVLKLQAIMKRKDLQISSLEDTLAQKTKANKQLTIICDELINKVG
ncbi:putative leucine-rich repeat-containing protein DDB_G0290503 [Pieris napi]|uniref:putative leucine-rich repeat-containing protein DDB_G0290503 n=1 Tax=Pieris napi TaxID=78633 RepID=UPI001FBA089F|nr:putative leucine-rich repeat-containing protein DDB_G0290503 [Pieris napi]